MSMKTDLMELFKMNNVLTGDNETREVVAETIANTYTKNKGMLFDKYKSASFMNEMYSNIVEAIIHADEIANGRVIFDRADECFIVFLGEIERNDILSAAYERFGNGIFSIVCDNRGTEWTEFASKKYFSDKMLEAIKELKVSF